MILRRIVLAIRQQQWTTFLLEMVIVTAGVFIGIEVSNWNEDRQSRNTERRVLMRLHEETLELAATRRDEVKALRERHATLTRLRPVLFSNTSSKELTENDCRNIAASHILPKPSDELPTLDEILGTGRIDMIRNQSVRATLREFVLYRARARSSYEEGSKDLFRLANRHPELLTWDYVPLAGDDPAPEWSLLSSDGYKSIAVCELSALRGSRAFLNDYVDNLGRLTYALLFNYDGIEKRLDALRASLAAEISTG